MTDNLAASNRPPASVLHAILSLSSLNGNKVRSSLYTRRSYNPKERDPWIDAQLPSKEELLRYRDAAYLTTKDHALRDECTHMCQLIGRVMPEGTQERLSQIAAEFDEPPTVALEVMINNVSLEQYPWELLAAQDLFSANFRGAGIWRRVCPEQRRNRIQTARVLLAGSSPMDVENPFTYPELERIERVYSQSFGISAGMHPAVPFGELINLLDIERPRVLHLAAHGVSSELLFQDRLEAPTRHRGIPSEEFAGFLQQSESCVLVYLGTCDSASCSEDGISSARCIAASSDTTVIGMSGEITPQDSLTFSILFHEGLAEGHSAVNAFVMAVARLLRTDHLPLWSMPVMYSTGADMVPFSSSDRTRAQLAVQEIDYQLSVIKEEVWRVNGPPPADIADSLTDTLSRAAFRVAMLRDTLDALGREASPMLFGALERLMIERARSDLDTDLERTEKDLGNLARRAHQLLAFEDFDTAHHDLSAALEATRKLEALLTGQ